MSDIHPTACIAESAKLGANCRIGPYAIIGEHVTLGDHSMVEAHGIVKHYVRAGSHTHVHGHAIIGGNPQDLGFRPDHRQLVWSWAITTPFAKGSLSAAPLRSMVPPESAPHNYFMANTHVAHDCVVGDHNVLANGATLAGHIQVGDRIFLRRRHYDSPIRPCWLLCHGGRYGTRRQGYYPVYHDWP